MKLKKKNDLKKNSLFKRILTPMCLLIVFIVVFMVGISIYYDILGELDKNSQNLFDQQVTNRAHDLQTSMVTKWSNIEGEMIRISHITDQLVNSKKISIDELFQSSSQSTLFLEQISDELITILRNHSTTGAYVLLSDGHFTGEDNKFCPGLYFTDNDPESVYGTQNSDLLLARCPVELVNKFNISTDSCWQPSFEFRKDDFEFYQNAFDNFKLALSRSDFTLKDVGCWVPPYKLYGSDTYAISYMLPLIYEGRIYGAVGIEISFSYLQKLLDYSELIGSGNSGYVLAMKNSDQQYQSMFLNGPYYSRSFQHSSQFTVEGTDAQYIGNNVYCSVSPLNLYNSNTPYESQQWVLLGLVDKSELYHLTYRLTDMVLIMFGVIIILGFLLSFMMTKFITKPIVDLADRISNSSNAMSRLNISKTNIIEIDQLIDAIEKMSNDVLESASRFTNIIRLANTQLAGFEIDYQTNQLFITDGFFEIFMLHDVDTKQMTTEQFKKIFKAFDSCCHVTQNRNEYIYHLETSEERIYLRLRYHETEEKCVGLIEEISDMIKERQAIEHERDHDVLTGLINRRAFQRQMKRLFSINTQELKIAALVMMDLDNLKAVNDKFGHDCGDTYIRTAATAFKDYAPKETIVSRTSGDEFYLFYYGYDNKESINQKIQELQKGISESLVHLPNHQEIKIRVSGGVAWYPEDSTDFDELQRYSDYAMYSVKHTVKGEIGTFNILDYENNSYITKKRIDFHQLLDDDLIYYVYQPIIDAKTGNIFGYEALMRSYHPSLKEPKEIITLAKLEAQLNKIELVTWYKALAKYSEYYQKGIMTSSQKLFINSISNQILDEKYLEDFESLYGNILDKIVLEVTEDEENDKNCFLRKKDILARWHAEVALDDYGSGYNSERNLLMVNPNYVKVDMDIIRDIDKDADKQKIVENIISYCHEREKKVIAEGVETIQELKVVLNLDVDYIQGFLFAKPDDIPSHLQKDAINILLELNRNLNK